MEKSIKDIIRARRSVRTFEEESILSEDVKQKITEFIAAIDNPFGVSIEFRLFNADEHDLKSTVIVGADYYVAAKVARVPQFEIAFGYSFEKFCLFAESIGLGTVMLAATISRSTFEKAMELKDNEVMPLASPIGYTCSKMSLRERIMRKTISADKRLPFETLFFNGSFDKPLSEDDAGKVKDALNMVRLAPSAVNKQPWRAVVCNDMVHFYEKRNSGMENELGDIQKVDMGIALAHFHLTAKEDGLNGEFVAKNPKLSDDLEYIISYEFKH